MSLESKLDLARQLLRKRRPLSEREVHDLRVAARRSRLLAALGAKALGKKQVKRFRTSTRIVLDALDPVRDCDLALAWLSGAGTSKALITKLRRRRAGLWLAARRHLKPRAVEMIETDGGSASESRALARRLDKHVGAIESLCRKLADNAAEAPVETLHRLRRVIRQRRYLREMELTPREIRRDRHLKTLVEVQEALGSLVDSTVILTQLKLLGRTKELETLRGGLEALTRHYHSEALQQVKRLPLWPVRTDW
jgi:CHAD domain-containing protein